MASNDNKRDNDQQNAPRPLRSTLTALGVGVAWAAIHMPATMGHQADVITWLVRALVAFFITLAALDLATAIVTWLVKLASQLLQRIRT